MSFKNLFLRTFAIAALGAASLFAPLGQAQAAGQQYVTLNPAQPSDTPDKIEILEFFAYSCPHCAAMQPMVEKWAKTLPSNVVLRQVPVAFNASMTDLQKLYYSLQALDRMDLNDEVFKAIHTEHKRIFEAKAIADWAVSKGIDRAKFEAVFNSFGINAKIKRANELTQSYQIEGTPSISVGGQYVVSPSMTNSYQGTIDVAQKLLDGLLKDKK
ncbi:MAG TPA: thiol:disulfide interchange protein DsbA/DsbL [Eoetvoesiella sp.]|jgi:thiol:disulfide interchange protein DsbA|uniref:thiol:disulfide interchange protein DsbA/DsbL n=1 Tax=Eoetvoesiella sp. TaxID=1966355 RepID=UPI002C4B3946|nr:thiol:disulfide interchange protein DsbA/DsbL [Eoetvoesiella sp.]HWK60208.1 thiol:disulfide interchange protein DsbA/DsbL [Eoetvoesiella sp.]